MINRFVVKYNEFLKFAIVGVSNLLISLITYYVLIFFSINGKTVESGSKA